QNIAAVLGEAFLRAQAVDQRDGSAQRRRNVRRVDVLAIQVPGVVQERKEQVEEQLAVRLAADVAAQKLRQRSEQALPQTIETADAAGLREEPQTVTERVGVLGAEGADGGAADVTDEGIGADVLGGFGQIDDRSLVDRATPEQGLSRLIKADTPAERTIVLTLHPQHRRALFEHTRAQIRAVAHEAEHAGHQ